MLELLLNSLYAIPVTYDIYRCVPPSRGHISRLSIDIHSLDLMNHLDCLLDTSSTGPLR